MKCKWIFVLILSGVMMSWFSFAKAGSNDDAARLYDFSLKSIDGADMPLSEYRGHPVLLVNTASKCGFTPQYDALQEIWRLYRARGLYVIATPSNDFGDQEPGSESEIKKFCAVNFNIDFPISSKISVVGKEADPLYRWISGVKNGGKPRWNFYKYLFDKNGRLVDSWSSFTKPDSDDIKNAIEQVL